MPPLSLLARRGKPPTRTELNATLFCADHRKRRRGRSPDKRPCPRLGFQVELGRCPTHPSRLRPETRQSVEICSSHPPSFSLVAGQGTSIHGTQSFRRDAGREAVVNHALETFHSCTAGFRFTGTNAQEQKARERAEALERLASKDVEAVPLVRAGGGK